MISVVYTKKCGKYPTYEHHNGGGCPPNLGRKRYPPFPKGGTLMSNQSVIADIALVLQSIALVISNVTLVILAVQLGMKSNKDLRNKNDRPSSKR